MGARVIRTAKMAMGLCGPYVESPADEVVEEMEDAEGLVAVRLAEEAIGLDPGCIPARLLLAEVATDVGDRIEHLDIAVSVGERLWGPVADKLGDQMAWSDYVGARPYLRAIEALGEAYAECGELDSALDCFEILARLEPRRAAREHLERTLAPLP